MKHNRTKTFWQNNCWNKIQMKRWEQFPFSWFRMSHSVCTRTRKRHENSFGSQLWQIWVVTWHLFWTLIWWIIILSWQKAQLQHNPRSLGVWTTVTDYRNLVFVKTREHMRTTSACKDLPGGSFFPPYLEEVCQVTNDIKRADFRGELWFHPELVAVWVIVLQSDLWTCKHSQECLSVSANEALPH